jgi:hypothetical protein
MLNISLITNPNQVVANLEVTSGISVGARKRLIVLT